MLSFLSHHPNTLVHNFDTRGRAAHDKRPCRPASVGEARHGSARHGTSVVLPGHRRRRRRRRCRRSHTLTRNFNFRSGRAITRRGEARRPARLLARNAARVVKHVQSYTLVFLFREWSLPPSLSPCSFAPEGHRPPIHRLVPPPFIQEYEIIGNQRYTGHSWRHNEPRQFVNECALVYARAITTTMS